MTTLTDKELIKEIKERISSLDVRDNIERRAYEIALASLEADPVAYIFKHPAGKLFWALTDESNKEQPDVIPVYAAAPALVVPDNASEPLAYAYKELTPEIMRNQAAESNRGNEWTGNPDIDNAIIMLDRIDTLENCDDDRIEAVKAVLRRLAGNSPVTPDGWVMVPKRLTAENGAKGALSGEFSETTFISCPECFGDDDCDTCDGSGRIEIKVPVTWTTIKSIWDKGIAYFAAEPPQEVK